MMIGKLILMWMVVSVVGLETNLGPEIGLEAFFLWSWSRSRHSLVSVAVSNPCSLEDRTGLGGRPTNLKQIPFLVFRLQFKNQSLLDSRDLWHPVSWNNDLLLSETYFHCIV